jgi:hypothetical protein
MGVKFTCPHCNSALNVKAELAGKRGRCPRCNEKISIPADSDDAKAVVTVVEQATVASGAKWTDGPVPVKAPVSIRATAPAKQVAPAKQAPSNSKAAVVASAPAQSLQPSEQSGRGAQEVAPSATAPPTPGPTPDPISDAPQLQWYVVPPGASSQYGPAAGEAFRAWIQEGRVTAESLVWRQDWPEWKRAGSVFPELDPAQRPVASTAGPGVAIPTAAGAFPTAAAVLPANTATPGFTPFDAAAAFASPALAGDTASASDVASAGDAAPAAGFDFSDLSAAPRTSPALPGGFSALRTGMPSISTSGGVSTRRRSASNNRPIIVIIALAVLLIPLSYLVWIVINEPPTAPAPETPAPVASPSGNEAGPDDSDE